MKTCFNAKEMEVIRKLIIVAEGQLWTVNDYEYKVHNPKFTDDEWKAFLEKLNDTGTKGSLHSS